MKVVCLNCLSPETMSKHGHCSVCYSKRIVSHPELTELCIAHIDCDSFYASVEKRDRPELLKMPVLVGGRTRGVVLAACYVARQYGIHSAMPMLQALRACPEAVVIPPNMSLYRQIGHEIRDMMRTVTPLVEPISIDEAFLDLTGTERLHSASPALTLARLAANIYLTHGITVTVGLSHNKFLSKLASGFNKPHGFKVIGKRETRTFLAALPVWRIWGVGAVFQRRLEQDGITTIGELQVLDKRELILRYGEMGGRLAALSQGHDFREVSASNRRKSLSSERTFSKDISEIKQLQRALWQQTEQVSAGLKKEGIGGRTVTLKLKTASFRTLTRSRTLPDPTQLAEVIYAAARHLLKKEANGISYRLLGVGLSKFSPAEDCDPIDLADLNLQHHKTIETVIDELRTRLGRDVIGKRRTIEN
ncbi:MAG: DNA polymerase IV [Pseudomonadota bacterium]|nr:DNA polymerase IV [Pseudomonadota bacterium]